ncbi:gliding motility-associated peptidyl-prolyl isomerase GldI [Christiangramia fulva]|uniref:Peptidyl-prolyl cis-trans isomerase n=1 Tax=Christiangramia fulva TaxID=2126553 RepID=A0A2R3Z6Q0_9FLAO|nr:gliding motility-associated peptidyl-prolyl isomerase GldI [Christiangramia fulva]AVR45930.1 gliding motility-associated peptidyl-prolyl isomerase GldI [Christiangramia fulva]
MKFRIISILSVFLLLAACKSPEARYPVSRKSGSYIDESVARNKKIVAQEEAQIQKIMEADSSTNYESSSNGFWYYYNKKVEDSISNRTPQFGDVVTFNYSISTLDGETIYPQSDEPRQYAIDKQKLFSGLRQGLKLMKKGETVTFLFPSHKAFGYYGDKKKIGTNVPIIAEVTLYDIEKETNNKNQ